MDSALFLFLFRGLCKHISHASGGKSSKEAEVVAWVAVGMAAKLERKVYNS